MVNICLILLKFFINLCIFIINSLVCGGGGGGEDSNVVTAFIVNHADIEMLDWHSNREKAPFPRALWLDDVPLVELLEGLNELRH